MSVCAILLSYKRPQNLQRILDEITQVPEVSKIILSNNNPDLDLRDWVNCKSPLLELIQQPVHCNGAKRIEIAAQQPFEFFLCPDDDLFLTAKQFSIQIHALKEQPLKVHGMYGQVKVRHAPMPAFVSGLHGKTAPLDILNRCYCFTQAHVQQMLALSAELGLDHITVADRYEDVLISFSGEGKPQCHAIGTIEDCPSSREAGVATYLTPGFDEIRARAYQRLSQITGRA